MKGLQAFIRNSFHYSSSQLSCFESSTSRNFSCILKPYICHNFIQLHFCIVLQTINYHLCNPFSFGTFVKEMPSTLVLVKQSLDPKSGSLQNPTTQDSIVTYFL